MAKLVMVVPAARDFCGRAVLLSAKGALLLGPFRVLATASRRVARKHGNPNCDQRLPFGHPPSGSYAIAGSLPPGRRRRARRFGRLGALVLEPLTGDALASVANGRARVVLHGGPTDTRGRLRRTRGGLRILDASLAALFRALNTAHGAGDPVSTVELYDLPAAVMRDPDGDALGGRELAPSAQRIDRARGSSVRAAGLLLAAGWSTSRSALDRRAFLKAALLVCGGLSLAACGGPGYVPPPYCDPAVDPSCDATGGGPTGGGDPSCGDPSCGDPSSGDPSSGDPSGDGYSSGGGTG